MGGLMQVGDAFISVQNSLSFIINSYTEIAAWSAVTQRLSDIRPAHAGRSPRGSARRSRSRSSHEGDGRRGRGSRSRSAGRHARCCAASRSRPAGRGGADHRPDRHRQEHADARDRGPVAVGQGRGAAGRRGASSSCRSGPICRSARWPTRCAIPISRRPSRGESRRCSRRSGSASSSRRSTTSDNWAQRLSLGEQQRLAFARVLLGRARDRLPRRGDLGARRGRRKRSSMPAARRAVASDDDQRRPPPHARAFHDRAIDIARFSARHPEIVPAAD